MLAQQIAAEVNAEQWDEAGSHALIRRAWPYSNLAQKTFNSVLRMLADGFTTRGRGGVVSS